MVDMGKDTPAKNRKSLKGRKSLIGGDSAAAGTPTPKKQNQNNPNGTTPKSAVKNKRKSVAGPLDSSEGAPKKQKLEKFGGVPASTDGVKKRRVEKLKSKRREHRKEYFEKVAQLRAGGSVDSAFLETITKRIAELEERPDKSATAKKKLRNFRHIYKLAAGQEAPKAVKQGKQDAKKPQAKPQQKTPQTQQQQKKSQQKQEQKKSQQKPAQKQPESEEESDEDEEESDEDNEDFVIDSVGKVDEESDDDEEASDEEDENEEDDDDEDDDDEQEEEEEEEDSKTPVKSQKQQKVQQQPQGTPGKKRYVLFVGNLSFEAQKEDVLEHFKKVGDIQDVRIATHPDSNRPRGFGYVELKTEEAYQKGLAMHHTMLKGRRINVEYTQGGNKNSPNQKRDIKAKNSKLHAMRRQGKFGGSPKQNNRSARRGKQQKGKQ